jgi:predicted nucleic acid-binding protein
MEIIDGNSNSAERYCVDSDVLIDFLRGVKTAEAFLARAITDKCALALSPVTVVELWSGVETAPSNPNWREKTERINNLLSLFVQVEVSDVAHLAGEIRRDYRTPFADAIIAASALHEQYALVSRNLKHFKPLEALGLKLIQPY